jgi:flagellar basal-body rod protein FlgG
MLHSIDLSRAAMLRQQAYLDVTAHNIANTSTPGFRALRAVLETGDQQPADPEQRTGTETPALPAAIAVDRLFTQGPIRQTGVATDLAIEGDGFFAVRLPNGAEAYTRNGAFRPDASGRLVDAAGNGLQPPITVPPGTINIRIGQDGTITALLDNGTMTQAGRLQLARFANPAGLIAGDGGLLTPTTASGPVQFSTPGQNGAGSVQAGALEGANTDITEQMTSLLAAQRAYQLNTSAFRMADQMLAMADQIAGTA